MTKQEFEELTGEQPDDVLGNDWENEIGDWQDETVQEVFRKLKV